jgi:hypothetical protein
MRVRKEMGFGILQFMTMDNILASIDSEIAHLKQARALLSIDGAKMTASAAPVHKRRKMSAASRKKIADAQRKRWAKQKATK